MLSIVCLPSAGLSGTIYSDCILGDQFGDDGAEHITLTPINGECQKRCEEECGSFSRKDKYNEELNANVITDCMSACQKGKSFTSTLLAEGKNPDGTTDGKRKILGPITTLVKCEDQNSVLDNIYQSTMIVHNGDKLKLYVAGDTQDNKVYLCGKKNVQLTPIFAFPHPKEDGLTEPSPPPSPEPNPVVTGSASNNIEAFWNSTKQPQGRWSSKYQHQCLSDLNNQEWQSLSNKKLWSTDGTYGPLSSHYPDEYRELYNSVNGPCKWSARNKSFTNTGIWVADGDELSIMWNGEYYANDPTEIVTLGIPMSCFVKDGERVKIRWNYCGALSDFPNDLCTTEGAKKECNDAISHCLTTNYKNLQDKVKLAEYCFNAGAYSRDGQPPRDPTWQTRNNFAKCIVNESVAKKMWPYSNLYVKETQQYCSKAFYESSKLHILKPQALSRGGVSSDTFNSKQEYEEICGEDARIPPNVFITTSAVPQPGSDWKYWHGLRGGITDTDRVIVKKTDNDGNIIAGCDQDYVQDPNCFVLDDLGYPRYIYSGVLQNFSSTRTPLAFRHSGIQSNQQIGGFNLAVDWGGCPRVNGEEVYYTVEVSRQELDKSEAAGTTDWQAVPGEVLTKGKDLVIASSKIGTKTGPKDGYIFLKIKSITPPPNAPDEIKEMYTGPGNRFGHYNLVMKRADVGVVLRRITGPMITVVKYVYDTLLGSDNTTGVVEKVFVRVVANHQFITIVKTLLVFYFCLLGASVVLGLVNLDHKETIMRLIKVSIVVALISPNSWEFFGGYLVDMLVKGGLAMIGLMASASSTELLMVTEAELVKEPALIFRLFDGPFSQMTDPIIWRKICGLLFSSLLGFFVTIILALTLLIYMITMAKVAVIYLYSLIMLSFLIIAGPIFIIFMLFENTKSFFEQWWKQLVSFVLQPMMLMTSVMLFNVCLIFLLYTILRFTVCKFCFLYIDLRPLAHVDQCLIPVWRLMMISHLPPSASTSFLAPMGSVCGSITFFLIVYGMFRFTQFITLVAGMMVTGNPIRIATAAAGAQAMQAPIEKSIKKQIGMR
ncbi:TrbL/VirB6 family protein [Rickettsiales endosymbiont of Peranema trichophorum]|uniref:type IV secretion system protein n=1 Tax=Rickettsiales endosymbiont of Peranema trichophorum TaxID=2486577 RepID=UPI0013EEB828|nr:type IV secretion system protein [Rickettsiales endosymbiont of Peranema trichophorum]